MQFLQNAWYVVALKDEVSEKPLARTILDQPIVLYRGPAGKVIALDDMCPHRFAPLRLGKVDGETIRCPYHGLVFDGGGKCVHNPHGKGNTPAALNVGAYDVRERNGFVWIWMGSKELAVASEPPAYDFLENTEYSTISGYLQVLANYELVTDNLMDLSHVEFLHPFLSPEGTAASTQFRAEQDGDRVAAINEMPDQPNTKLFEMLLGEDVERIDSYANTYWDAPANMRIDVGAVAADGSGRNAKMCQTHLLTPETATTTHYFWAAARDQQVGNEQLDGILHQGFMQAFQYEDEPMIKAVQERMRDRALFDMAPALLPMDESSVRARRILEKRIREENTGKNAASGVAQ